MPLPTRRTHVTAPPTAAGGRLGSDAVAAGRPDAPGAGHHPAHLVSWNFTTTETYAASGEPFPAGSTTLARIVYDPEDVQPNGDAVIVGHQDYLGRAWADPDDSSRTPVSPLRFLAACSQSEGSLREGGHYAFDEARPQPCNARTWYNDGSC